jgi:hypothetical protein
MGWERRRSGRYYYRARKINGRVVKEYVGQGHVQKLPPNGTRSLELHVPRHASSGSGSSECFKRPTKWSTPS